MVDAADGHHNHRPRWRSDASGAGQPDTGREAHGFVQAALDLALSCETHDATTLSDLVGVIHVLPPADQEKVWDLVDAWAEKEQDDTKKAVVCEHIRRFAFTGRSKHRRINSRTKDRARRAHASLTPRDVVIRHQWLFAEHWLQESVEEIEDDHLDYRKREERVRNARVAALREIWTQKGFDGIRDLTAIGGASGTIGWHLADGVIDEADFSGFLTRCLAVGDPALAGKIDELVGGFLRNLAREIRLAAARALAGSLRPDQICRLLKASPFERDTWLLVDAQEPAVRERYWRDVYPGCLHSESPDLNEAVDRLLEAGRPRAAFHTAHMAFDNVETARLRRLLDQRLFVQVLALAFKRSDDRQDPPEWRIQNDEQRQALALAADTLLDRIRRIPGTDDNGTINAADIKTWVTETRALCLELGRAAIGDQKIGQVLSAAPVGADGVWPCEPVRDVLEDVASREIAIGMGVAVYNARGMHGIWEEAADERDLAAKYRAWARKLAFGHPYVATLVEEIAARYDHEAEREISDAAVRRRLRQ